MNCSDGNSTPAVRSLQEVSQPAKLRLCRPGATGAAGGVGIPGGVGGGPGYDGYVTFYVGVPDVEAALRKAESLGGTRQMGPARAPDRELVVGHFTDPEGHLVGVAGPA